MGDETTRDPLDELAWWLDRHPQEVAAAIDCETVPDEAERVVSVSGGTATALVSPATRRPRIGRRRAAVAAVSAGVVAAAVGGLGVAAWISRGQPTQPQLPVACRAEAATDADAVLIDAQRDPIAGCQEVWRTGDLRDTRGDRPVPHLFVCIANGGVTEVFPGDGEGCADLGLEPADPQLSPESEALVAFNERIIAEINSQPCQSGDEAQAHASSLLEDAGLADWRVQIDPNTEGLPCAMIAADPAARELRVFGRPDGP